MYVVRVKCCTVYETITLKSSNRCFKYVLVAKRFKNFRRFVYDYETETFNGMNGATKDTSGPKISCKVRLTALIITANTLLTLIINHSY